MLMMLILLVIAAVASVVILLLRRVKKSQILPEDPSRVAGMEGEKVATDVIKTVLQEEDHLFTNVKLSFENKDAEMDNIVVNRNGVFVFEVKNYTGKLYGKEDDYEWNKYKTTESGNVYKKAVKNPIKQVKRQSALLSKYLKYYKCGALVEGRAILINRNSPVKSRYIISSTTGIERLIHTPAKKRLDSKTVTAICCLLST